MVRYVQRLPAPVLAPYVSALYEAVVDRSAERASWQTITPDGAVELNLTLGDPVIRSTVEGETKLPRLYVVGRMHKPYRVRRTGHGHVIGVRFKPGGFTALTRIPAVELQDQVQSAADVFGPHVDRIGDQLLTRPTSTAPLDVLETWLVGLVTTRLATNQHVQAALQRIIASRGMASIAEISSHVPIGPRRLEQCFITSVGVSPKVFSRLVRFHAVLSAVKQSAFDPMDSVVAFGFYDQPHLIREFKGFAGTTPLEYRNGYYPLNEAMRTGQVPHA